MLSVFPANVANICQIQRDPITFIIFLKHNSNIFFRGTGAFRTDKTIHPLKGRLVLCLTFFIFGKENNCNEELATLNK